MHVPSEDKVVQKEEAAMADVPVSDPATPNTQLLATLTSIDSKLEEQGAISKKMTISQTVLQKSIDYAHANTSDLIDRVVMLEREKNIS